MAKAKLQGTIEFPFSTLVRETIEKHGEGWAFDYYVRQQGLARWEYRLFAGLGMDDGMEARTPIGEAQQDRDQPREPWEHFAH